jgi:Kef-type K+ transport system membrane component KefB
VKQNFIFFAWFLHLFNPPPLNSMTWLQKVGRILLVSVALIVTSTLLAMLTALGFFLVERGRQIVLSSPQLRDGTAIILVGVGVNWLCVRVLFAVIKADRKLMAPSDSK